MGVPAFYRWLSEKYPKICQDVLEERYALKDNGQVIPVDITKPNPSGLETDNFYIDMNGIIHPCTHPEHGPQPSSQEEMFDLVCLYVKHLVEVVRPRKLLFLAIDGVAPRAKMNQQRSRRFRSAQEARELKEMQDHVQAELEQQGMSVPKSTTTFDSNVITPGTKFMLDLSEHLRFFIRQQIATDKAWQKFPILFSDASIPGEGEHKIMNHVRLQRSQPLYNPNLVHTLHGLDADLIMLALATHETHFYILREEVTFGRKSQERLAQRRMQSGHTEKQELLNQAAGGDAALSLKENSYKAKERVSIPILREYLQLDFGPTLSNLPFTRSLERLVDDVVFLCFFVGNDFLPHLPSLDIRSGALDFLFNVYKRLLPTMGDYITNHGGRVNLRHVQTILKEVGAIEDYVFQLQHEQKQRQDQQHKNRKKLKPGSTPPPPPPPPPRQGRAARILEKRNAEMVPLQRNHEAKEDQRKNLKKIIPFSHNTKAAMELKEKLGGTNTAEASKVQEAEQDDSPQVDETEEVEFDGSDIVGTKRKAESIEEEEEEDAGDAKGEENAPENSEDGDDDDDDEDEDNEESSDDAGVQTDEQAAAALKTFKEKVKAMKEKQLDQYAKTVEDKVRLYEPGWKDRYYSDKCKADDVANHGGREHLFRSYVMGLCWVMKYYYDGCPSWKWYYPFHYAPFASDLMGIERYDSDVKSFDLAVPFNPVEQLMAVLPSDSSHAIPAESRWLMCDEESPIIDFYPSDVPCDPNGKAMPWLWVVLLPFIDEERLLAAMKPSMEKWTKKELLCNARGLDDGYLYVHMDNPIASKLKVVLEDKQKFKNAKSKLSGIGVSGSIRVPLSNELYDLTEETSVAPPHDGLEPIDINTAVCVTFSEPPKLPHKSILLPGAIAPPPTLTARDANIGKPRLNRGGGTIANMGLYGSFNSGQGSMNIGSYERQLAHQTGRGADMYQTGQRQWGSMEPAPKRPRGDYHRQPPYQPNPFVTQPSAQYPQFNSRPPWQNQQQQQQGSYSRPNSWQQTNNQGAHQQRQGGYQQGQHQRQGGYQQGQQQGGYRQLQNPQYQQQQRPGQYNQQRPGQYNRHQQGSRPPPPPPRQGFAFNRNGQQRQPQQQHDSRVNPNVMSNLRSQLANTLQQNKRGQGRR